MLKQIIVLFTLTSSVLNAQIEDRTIYVGNVVSDTLSFKNSASKSPFESILTSNNKIEIRFKTSSSPRYTNYIILTFNQTWNAKFYSLKLNTDSLVSNDLTSKTTIDSLFSKLVSNNIFSLPDQDSLTTNKYSYDLETDRLIGSGMGVGCGGTCYYVEFKVGNFYRKYSYCSPDIFADFYPNVYELRSFVNIVDLFNELKGE